MRVELPDLSATQKFASRIAAQLKEGDVIALSGDLGTGKTTVARAVLRALGYVGEVPSPTFTIIETYLPPAVEQSIVHADFYRLDDPSEVLELGLEDYREGAALLAEWPEHAGGFTHEEQCLSVRLEKADVKSGENSRIAIVERGQDWLTRWP